MAETQQPDLVLELGLGQQAFEKPTADLYNTALSFAISHLDPLASDISETRAERQKEFNAGKKRKRGEPAISHEPGQPFRIKRIHTQGFPTEQIWRQTRQVLEAALEDIETQLPALLERNGLDVEEILGQDEDEDIEDGDDDQDKLGEEGVDYEIEGVDDDSELQYESSSDEESDGSEDMEDVEEDEDEGTPISDISDEDAEIDEDDDGNEFIKDKHGLNDGFFSIDDFNKQTQFLERQDERGDPNDGAASDEEDIDWDLDPLAMGSKPTEASKRKTTSKRDLEENEDMLDEEDEDDEAGPTFGNADLSGIGDDTDEEMDDDGDDDADMAGMGNDFSNTNDVMYKDFFAPPAKQASGKRESRPSKTRGSMAKSENHSKLATEDDAEDDLEKAMSRVHRDLFEDEASEEEIEEDEGAPEPGTRGANMSSHERRQLALRAEIRRLEAENVANKPWSMTGETLAPARPENALLEEDLEFERAGKPVPMMTAEITESIEQLIKRRILNKEFDELIRRRPTDLVTGPDPKRGRVREELSDSKHTKGLAEEYEEDFLRKNDPNYVDTRSEALKLQHKQIEEQWRQISAQLDSLSNFHYKPRPAEANLEVRVDAPTISMEDAQPSAAGIVGGTSALAPQEIYKPGEDGKVKGEVLTKGGNAVNREEMTREDSKRRRRRDKERKRKSESNKPLAVVGGNAGTSKRAVADQLKKSGVKVIGKKGEIKDAKGKASTLGEADRSKQIAGTRLKL